MRTRVWDDVGGPDSLTSLYPLYPLYPLGRVGEPEDIAAATAFLTSPDGAWIMGITLPADGGVLIGPGRAVERPRG